MMHGPATIIDIELLEERIGVRLADGLRALYLSSNGEDPADAVTGRPYRRLSLAEVVAAPVVERLLVQWASRELFKLQEFTLWPFWTNDRSDYVAMFLGGPLDGHLVWVYRDEGAALLAYRDVSSLLRHFAVVRAGKIDIFEDGIHDDFCNPLSDRTTGEQHADWERIERLAAFVRETDELEERALETLVEWMKALCPQDRRDVLWETFDSIGLSAHAEGPSALDIAVYSDDVDVLRDVIANTTSLDFTSRGGDLLLSVAAGRGSVDLMDALLDAGADVNSQDENGETALHRAAWESQDVVVQRLIERGANPDLPNVNRCLPLHFACLRGKPDMVKRLLAAGTEVSLQTTKGSTPLTLAARGGHTEIAHMLLDRGAAVDVQDGDGFSPLERLQATGDQNLVRRLRAFLIEEE